MKLSTVFAKLTSAKKALTLIGGMALAGAILTVAAPRAQAQGFGVGVQFGGPVYRTYAPAYADPRYAYGEGDYGQERAEAWRQQQWRQQQWREQQGREQQWREQEWREREAREHAWHEREEWGHRGGDDGRGYDR